MSDTKMVSMEPNTKETRRTWRRCLVFLKMLHMLPQGNYSRIQNSYITQRTWESEKSRSRKLKRPSYEPGPSWGGTQHHTSQKKACRWSVNSEEDSQSLLKICKTPRESGWRTLFKVTLQRYFHKIPIVTKLTESQSNLQLFLTVEVYPRNGPF